MKLWRIAWLACFLCVIMTTTAYAKETDVYELSGADALMDALPEETRSFLASFELSPDNTEPDMLEKLLDALRQATLAEMDSPVQVFVKLLSVLLVTRMVLSVAPPGLHHTVSFCSVLSLGVLLIPKITELIERTAYVVQALSGFLVAAVPVYTAIITLSGNPVTGSSYGALTLTAANALSVLQGRLILPFTRVFLAFAAVSAVTESGLHNVSQTLYRAIKWGLTTAVSVFTGIISLQTLLSAQADAVTGKTVKMVASGAIPIVGGAFGDALSVLSAGVTTVKSGIGAFGVLATVVLFLPLCIRIALWLLMGEAVLIVADLFSISGANIFLNGCVTTLKTLLAVLFSTGAAAMISAAILLCVRNAYG